MKKEKLFIIIILILVLINSATLLMMWLNRPPHPPMYGHGPHKRPDKIIIEKLKLDEAQQEKFSLLKEEHHSNMVRIDDELRKTRTVYFGELKKENADKSITDSLETITAQLNIEKERATFDHFQKLKSLCKPDQLDDFYLLIDELSEIFSRPPLPPGNK